MPPSYSDEILSALLGGAVIVLFAVVLGAWGWAFWRLARREPLLAETPLLPLLPARWGGGSVGAMIVLYVGVNLFVGLALGPTLGLKRPARDAAPPSTAVEGPEEKGTQEPPSGEPAEPEDETPSPDASRAVMELNAIASVLFLMFLPGLLRRTAGVAIADLGVSDARWPRQVGVGVVAALLATPAVYAIHLTAARVWETNEHPVEKMMTGGLSLGTAALAFFSTVFLAPLVEETMFRGVLLGWLTRVFSPAPPVPAPAPASDSAPAAAPPLAAEMSPTPPEPTETPTLAPTVESAPVAESRSSSPEPAENAPLLAPAPETPNVVCWPAIATTSLLFAGLHASQWPAPIGIFFLSMVLGAVYQRTGSLLTSMVMHGVFNGCSTLLFLIGALARSLQGGEPGPDALPSPAPALRAVLEFFQWIG